MKKKLFVSNLDFEVSEDDLKEVLTNEVEEAASVSLATDRESGRSKGFAFVEMKSEDAANKAIEVLNNREIKGRSIKVSEDRGKGGGGAPAGGPRGGRHGGPGGKPGDAPKREHLPPIQRMSLFRRRRKVDPFLEDPTKTIDYRDVTMLRRFVSERGRILSRRLTGLSAYNQRKVKKAIKRAQNLGLMPFQLK